MALEKKLRKPFVITVISLVFVLFSTINIEAAGVQLESGGVRFPDNTLQSTAATGGSNSGWTDDGSTVRLTTSTDKVGIGTTSPDEKLEVAGDSTETGINVSTYSSDVNHDAFVNIRRARGTMAVPSALLSGDIIGSYDAQGYAATDWGDADIGISFSAAENWTDTAQGSSMSFWTTPNGTINPALAMTIANTGNVSIAQNLSVSGTVDVQGDSNTQGNGFIGGTLNVGGLLGATLNGLNVQGNGAISGTLNCNNDVSINGNLNVTGSLSKGGGSFKIDHPLDPENKYLSHSFVESPDMMNVYNGNVVLDQNGVALVELPEYFEALNSDFRYQLTAIGTPAPNLYIAEKISGNRFKISGGKAGMEVSWQVTGIRQDAYAKVNRIVTEENKYGEERGLYLHPAAYGLPVEKGVEALNNPQLYGIRKVAKKVD